MFKSSILEAKSSEELMGGSLALRRRSCLLLRASDFFESLLKDLSLLERLELGFAKMFLDLGLNFLLEAECKESSETLLPIREKVSVISSPT